MEQDQNTAASTLKLKEDEIKAIQQVNTEKDEKIQKLCDETVYTLYTLCINPIFP